MISGLHLAMTAWLEQADTESRKRVVHDSYGRPSVYHASGPYDNAPLAFALVVVALELFLILYLGSKVAEAHTGMGRNARLATLLLFPELYAAVYFLGGRRPAVSPTTIPSTLEDVLRRGR